MRTRPLLCGWVNFHGAPASHDYLQRMLAAESIGMDAANRVEADGCLLALAGSRGDVAHQHEHGAMAVVLGTPRWSDPKLAEIAVQAGHAAAALTAYREAGEEFLARIQGSFSLVVVDLRLRQAVLAVDRTGTERICLARAGETLVFSTSARSVARHPDVAAPVQPQALYEYLYCHVVPSPDTAFAGVDKLLPGERFDWDRSGGRRAFYWQLAYDTGPTGEDARCRETFLELVRQAVARQHDARRATGSFLSGGTDSSTVSGLLGEVGGKPAETFSIGFEADGFDELEYARITSRHFGTHSHEYYVTPEDVAEAIPLIANAYDEPFGNASAAPTYFCAKLAREHGMDVMLAGDGGDEFFGGNERYSKQQVFERYRHVPGLVRAMLEPMIFNFPLGESLMPVRKARSYIRQARIPLPDRLETYNFMHRQALEEVFVPEFLSIVDTDRPLALMREAYSRCASDEPIERMMHLDHKFTLADNDLRKVGRMCEMAGIEVRFPFLDDDLVAFSARLRPEQKVRDGRLRVLFKDSLRGFLPDETITKSKHGFGLPFGMWLRDNSTLNAIVRDALGSLAQRGIVRRSYLEGLLAAHAGEHASYFGVMIWVLVQMELWLAKNPSAAA